MSRLSFTWLMVATACGGDKTTQDDSTTTTVDSPVEEEQIDVEGCPDDPERFESRIWSPILMPKCSGCHVSGGVAESTRMVLMTESTDGWLEANMETVRNIATTFVDDTSLLLLKPTNTHPEGHGGGNVLSTTGTPYAELSLYVDRVTGEVEDCDEDPPVSTCDTPLPSARRLRRLTSSEYNQTVVDLLGDSIEEVQFASDDVIMGFDNNAGALDVSALLADQYRTAAETLANQADLDTLITCDPAVVGLSNCAYEFIDGFGLKAFRRPLDTSELTAYYDLWAQIVIDDGFDEAVRWVIIAMLQSPHFLYRTELGAQVDNAAYILNDWEIASALSYLFWGGPPDEVLMNLASNGELTNKKTRIEQAHRLLNDPRSHGVLHRFSQQWLDLEQLQWVFRDPQTYPEFSEQIRQAMEEETRRMFVESVESEETLSELLVNDHSYMTAELAAFYGLDPSQIEQPVDDNGFGRIQFESPLSGGLLSQGSVLATHALPTGSSPVHRGVFVRERILCDHLPPPPANLDTSPPPVDQSLSTRQRYEQHSSDPACSGCHQLIDPIGFGFEHFDGIGRFRELDGQHLVDASGEIIGTQSANATFYGVGELSSLLANNPQTDSCYIQMWMTYGLGHSDAEEIECLTNWVQNGLSGSPTTTQTLMGLVSSEVFTTREGQPDESDVIVGDIDADLPWVDPIDDISEPTPPALEVVVDIVSDWGDGYCADVYLTNTSQDPITWEIELDLDGVLSSHWSANVQENDGVGLFWGVDWNATINPSETTQFGFCVTR